jgi:hypothetical protein
LRAVRQLELGQHRHRVLFTDDDDAVSVPAMLEVISTGTTAPFSAMSGAFTLMSPLLHLLRPTDRSRASQILAFEHGLVPVGRAMPGFSSPAIIATLTALAAPAPFSTFLRKMFIPVSPSIESITNRRENRRPYRSLRQSGHRACRRAA